jgi:hypothetical protein
MKPSNTLAALVLAACTVALSPAHAAPSGPVQGEVLEIRDVESYTYLRLATPGGEVWAAVPTAKVKKGDRVAIANPMVMEHFESKTLKKTFDKIVFGQLATPGSAGAAPPAAPAAPAAKEAPVARASGADAHTVAELYKGKAALKDKPVQVRGRVVKVSNGILGKNWLHLQDGSGSASEGSNDVVVTSKDTAAVGDVVTARGTVRTDVDVGSGYSFAVMVEGATLAK